MYYVSLAASFDTVVVAAGLGGTAYEAVLVRNIPRPTILDAATLGQGWKHKTYYYVRQLQAVSDPHDGTLIIYPPEGVYAANVGGSWQGTTARITIQITKLQLYCGYGTAITVLVGQYCDYGNQYSRYAGTARYC